MRALANHFQSELVFHNAATNATHSPLFGICQPVGQGHFLSASVQASHHHIVVIVYGVLVCQVDEEYEFGLLGVTGSLTVVGVTFGLNQ